MSQIYPFSAESGKRLCSQFYLSGTEYPESGCPVYPCIHTESRDIDWLEDQEDLHKSPNFHELIWHSYYHRDDFNAFKSELSPKAYSGAIEMMYRCERLVNKREVIEAERKVVRKLRNRERREYFAYWDSFTQQQLTKFRKDPVFRQAERRYIRLKRRVR